MKTFLKNKKGFTLTELMIVVVILGILVLIAVPIYNNVTVKAETSTCAANRRTIESAIIQYCAVEGIELTDFDLAAAKTELEKNYINEWPKCPSVSDAETTHDYEVTVTATGVVKVTCTFHQGDSTEQEDDD
jgi:prepilin-type N-terminal cleavage/methylation domain-containing protein